MAVKTTDTYRAFIEYCSRSSIPDAPGKIQQLQTKIPQFSKEDYFRFTDDQLAEIQRVAAGAAKPAAELAQEEADRRLKRKIIYNFNKRIDFDLLTIFRNQPRLFKDKEFLFEVVDLLIQHSPEQLCEYFLPILPLSDRNQALLLGARLEDAKHRVRWVEAFGARFAFNKEDLESEHQKFLKKSDSLDQAMHCSLGICHGLTCSVASQELYPSTDELWKKGRFIHSSYYLGTCFPNKNPQKLADEILKRPHRYPYVLKRALNLLHFQNKKELLDAYAAGERTLEIATVVGNLAQKLVKDHAENLAELVKSNNERMKFFEATQKLNKKIGDLELEISSLRMQMGAEIDMGKKHGLQGQIVQKEQTLEALKADHATLREAHHSVADSVMGVLDRIQAAKRDVRRLKALLPSIEPLPGAYRGKVPEPILKKLKIREEAPFIKDKSLDDLGLYLAPLTLKPGTYFLEVNSEERHASGAAISHVLLFSIPERGMSYFYDMNDLDPSTLLPVKRTFLTPEKMLASLHRFCDRTYTGQYSTFSISRCSKSPSLQSKIPVLKSQLQKSTTAKNR